MEINLKLIGDENVSKNRMIKDVQFFSTLIPPFYAVTSMLGFVEELVYLKKNEVEEENMRII